MAGLNKIILIGFLGTDPEMRYTPNGNPVTSFRLATTRTYSTAEGERRDETEWFTVVAWNRLAEQVNQFMSKGRQAYVEGRLRTRTWETREGQTRFDVEVTANQVLFLDRQPAAGLPEDSPLADDPRTDDPSADDIPF